MTRVQKTLCIIAGAIVTPIFGILFTRVIFFISSTPWDPHPGAITFGYLVAMIVGAVIAALIVVEGPD